MEKRINARGIIIEDNSVYLMFRRRIKEDGSIKEYYVIPGGGKNEEETVEENVIREIREEFSVDVRVTGYIGMDETEDAITHFFACEIVKGIPKLGGEELERFTESNYYEIRKILINELDHIDVSYKDIILKVYNHEYV